MCSLCCSVPSKSWLPLEGAVQFSLVRESHCPPGGGGPGQDPGAVSQPRPSCRPWALPASRVSAYPFRSLP